MKFDLSDRAGQPLKPAAPRVGDVYPAKATGPKFYRRGTRYWVIVSITPGQYNSCVHHMLGLDSEGNINSTTTYGGHVMAERERLGHVDLSDLNNLRVIWEKEDE